MTQRMSRLTVKMNWYVRYSRYPEHHADVADKLGLRLWVVVQNLELVALEFE